jgi:hypothetical protein
MSLSARRHQVILICSFLPLCWLGMQIIHELGHVFAAWSTHGTVLRVVLPPLGISRTDVQPNPKPIVVAWAGPIFGSLMPMLLFQFGRLARLRLNFLLQFFAGFCLIANGLYIACGSFDGVGDAGDLLRSGSPTWLLWLFGLLTVPSGFWLWHGLGPDFGLGSSQGKVEGHAPACSCAVLLVVLVAELGASW